MLVYIQYCSQYCSHLCLQYYTHSVLIQYLSHLRCCSVSLCAGLLPQQDCVYPIVCTYSTVLTYVTLLCHSIQDFCPSRIGCLHWMGEICDGKVDCLDGSDEDKVLCGKYDCTETDRVSAGLHCTLLHFPLYCSAQECMKQPCTVLYILTTDSLKYMWICVHELYCTALLSFARGALCSVSLCAALLPQRECVPQLGGPGRTGLCADTVLFSPAVLFCVPPCSTPAPAGLGASAGRAKSATAKLTARTEAMRTRSSAPSTTAPKLTG